MLERSKSIDPSNQKAFIDLISKYYDTNTAVTDDMASIERFAKNVF